MQITHTPIISHSVQSPGIKTQESILKKPVILNKPSSHKRIVTFKEEPQIKFIPSCKSNWSINNLSLSLKHPLTTKIQQAKLFKSITRKNKETVNLNYKNEKELFIDLKNIIGDNSTNKNINESGLNKCPTQLTNNPENTVLNVDSKSKKDVKNLSIVRFYNLSFKEDELSIKKNLKHLGVIMKVDVKRNRNGCCTGEAIVTIKNINYTKLGHRELRIRGRCIRFKVEK